MQLTLDTLTDRVAAPGVGRQRAARDLARVCLRHATKLQGASARLGPVATVAALLCEHVLKRTASVDPAAVLDAHFPNAATAARAWSANASAETWTELRSIVAAAQPDAEILAWLYQELRAADQKRVSGASLTLGTKIAGDDVLAATQFFTDDYMVQYLVDSVMELLDHAERRSATYIDPACGGGNFLLAVLRALHARALAAGEDAGQVVQHAVAEQLLGFDLDPHLAEVAAMALWVEATKLLGRAEAPGPGIFGGTPGDERGFLDATAAPDFFARVSGARRRVFLTNPPFLGRRLMGRELKDFLRRDYPDAGNELSVAFLLALIDHMQPGDLAGVVHQTNWMYLTSYRRARGRILRELGYVCCADLGANAFKSLTGEKARVALSVFRRGQQARTTFIRLVNHVRADKIAALRESPMKSQNTIDVDRRQLLENVSAPIRYHVDSKARALLDTGPHYGDFAEPMQGTSTGDNRTFVLPSWARAHWDADWRPVSKGGGHCKWAGLNRNVVRWGDDGRCVRENPGSALRNLDRIDKAQLVYSDTGTSGMNVRVRRSGQIFIASGPGIYVTHGDPLAHLAYLNSRIASYFMRTLSPKLTISAGYIAQLPFAEAVATDSKLAAFARRCVELKQAHVQTKLRNDEATLHDEGSVDLHDESGRLLLSDLEREARRLELEWKIERRCTELLELSKTTRHNIAADVGTPTAAARGRRVDLSPAKLDAELARTLDETCQYRSGRGPSIYAREGPLESLCVMTGVSPAAMLQHCQRMLGALDASRRLYAEDLAHKATLRALGFRSNRAWEPGKRDRSEVQSLLRDRLAGFDDLLGADWMDARLLVVHGGAMRPAPLLRLTRKSILLEECQ